MKIKHFAGYGSVNAVKLKNVETGRNAKQLVIKVTGNHEYGLLRNDAYDVFNWLVKRFCKDCISYTQIKRMLTESRYERINNLDVETCTYYISYEV